MKNNSNIYDIDGKLLRSVDDTTKLTIDEASERIEYYKNKISELSENDPKVAVYNTYINNLNKYIIETYSNMSTDELKAELDRQSVKYSTQEQIQKAINELKEETESEESEEAVGISAEPAERQAEPVKTQEDMLVEDDGSDTVMDEYVEFEDV